MELGVLTQHQDCRLEELLQRYKQEITPTKKGAVQERYRIDKLCRHPIGEIRISDLASHHIVQYRDERAKTASGQTVLKDLLLISHAIKTAQREWGFELPSNPVHNVNKPPVNKPRDRRLEEGEEERLFQICKQSSNHWFIPLVQVAIETGTEEESCCLLHGTTCIWIKAGFISP